MHAEKLIDTVIMKSWQRQWPEDTYTFSFHRLVFFFFFHLKFFLILSCTFHRHIYVYQIIFHMIFFSLSAILYPIAVISWQMKKRDFVHCTWEFVTQRVHLACNVTLSFRSFGWRLVKCQKFCIHWRKYKHDQRPFFSTFHVHVLPNSWIFISPSEFCFFEFYLVQYIPLRLHDIFIYFVLYRRINFLLNIAKKFKLYGIAEIPF